MSTPSEKGDALEAAVREIERLILATSPALKDKTFRFESKKIITVGGVHHEIDILVTIDLGDGYKSVFIFECKNWQESVGKNEVIVFAEKINVTQATHGYFVAKSFTRDARSQAATNHRISFLIASEIDPAYAILPFGFHQLFVTPVTPEAMFYVRGGDHTKQEALDLRAATAKLHGVVIDLQQYLSKWAEEACTAESRSFRSERVPDGTYQRRANARRDFAPGEFTLDGRDIERVESSIVYNATVTRPAVVSYFEVESRGRCIQLAPVQIPTGPMMHLRITTR